MTQCRNCGAHVTAHFARVFGDNGDHVHGCLECIVNTKLHDGGGLSSDDSSGSMAREDL